MRENNAWPLLPSGNRGVTRSSMKASHSSRVTAPPDARRTRHHKTMSRQHTEVCQYIMDIVGPSPPCALKFASFHHEYKGDQQMLVGVPKEIKDHEDRVGLVPSGSFNPRIGYPSKAYASGIPRPIPASRCSGTT